MIIYIVCFAVILILIFCVKYSLALFKVHNAILNEAHSYKEVQMMSENGEYCIHTKKIENKSGVYMTFIVEDTSENRVIYECNDVYRAYDLKSIGWNGLDIIIKSGDVGEIIYYYDKGIWIK